MGFKTTLLPVPGMLQSSGRLLDISAPLVMGILNATPDSFYNKGMDSSPGDLLRNAEQMLADGAAILDIGGASSRPGAAVVSADEELRRIIPAITAILQQFPEAWLSVDTFHATVAREAVFAGAHIINDISAGAVDTAMRQTVAGLQVPYIAMHMQGTPRTMQDHPVYEDVVQDVFDYLKAQVLECAALGIHDLILDPGFGFGKTVAHNFSLLGNLHVFRALGKPILAGVSRKSMICKPLKINPDKALNGTTALHMIALQQGASFLRAHDVREAMECIRLYQLLS